MWVHLEIYELILRTTQINLFYFRSNMITLIFTLKPISIQPHVVLWLSIIWTKHTSTEQEHSTCPITLTSNFACRTSGIFEICNVFFLILINYLIRTEQNRTNFISNVYIVHSFQHITYNTRDKGRKENRKKEKVVISQFGESK